MDSSAAALGSTICIYIFYLVQHISYSPITFNHAQLFLLLQSANVWCPLPPNRSSLCIVGFKGPTSDPNSYLQYLSDIITDHDVCIILYLYIISTYVILWMEEILPQGPLLVLHVETPPFNCKQGIARVCSIV